MVFLHQLVDDKVLGKVGILILIDQKVAKLVLVKLQHVGVIAEENIGIEQQVVEVHRTGPGTTAPIGLVYIADKGPLRLHVGLVQGGIGSIGRGGDEGILGVGDNSLHGSRFVDFVVERHLLDNCLYEAARVGLVVNRKVAREAYPLGMSTQDT